MLLIIGFLTALLILACLFLILLVLMQLPKKEAGAGLAFGGAATDALFGAGSGNFLTKATKYSAIAFFVLAILISVLQNHYSRSNVSEFEQQLKQQQNQPILPATPPAPQTTAPATIPATNAALTNFTLTTPAGISNTAPATKP
jgi:preprotein translocase subunit SecG